MPATLQNFGRNVSFAPSASYAPRTEAELLDIMTRHRGEKIRVHGSLHSWSEVAATTGVALDLRFFDQVRVEREGDRVYAMVGAGCRIKRVLSELRGSADLTLPTIGVIDEQTLVGAAATGTHGSGRHCLSHFVVSVTVAVYDPVSDEAVLRTFDSGPELEAARCSLGCMGVIVSLRIRVRPQYRVEEHFAVHDRLSDVLAAEDRFPLQQAYLLPWAWRYFTQHRREIAAPRSRLAGAYRGYCFTILDVGLHVAVLAVTRMLRSARLTRLFYRRLAPAMIPRGWRVVERSDRQLTMEHDLFRHIEIELFVTRSCLNEALAFLRAVLCFVASPSAALPPEIAAHLLEMGHVEDLQALKGSYTHHYPICLRRVEPDETLISMTSGGEEARYAISLISYARQGDRGPFVRLAELLTVSMGGLFQARPHWGKVCPVDRALAASLCPRLDQFRRLCGSVDPKGRFRNDWVSRVLF